MPQCPLHQSEELEPKRKGWFCEECGAIVLGFDSFARPGAEPERPVPKAKPAEPKPYRPKAHSLPFPASDGTPTHPLPKPQPDLLKRDDTTRWALAPAAARSARETLRCLASAGLPASIHVPRSGIDDVLPLCFARPRRALLVVGPPGVGKTALLARVVEQALGVESTSTNGGRPAEQDSAPANDIDARDVVIFLSGRSAYEADTAKTSAARLCDAIVRCADVQVGEFQSLEDFVSHVAKTGGRDPKPQRKIWLVLDGIDEARAHDGLIEALDAFLPVVETHAWLRVVVSMRRSTYDALAARGAEHTFGPCGAFVSERWWTWFSDEATGRDVPFLALRRFDDGEEVRRAYATRQEAMAHRACKIPFDELPSALRGLLRVPLHLHLFHDAFRGDKAPPGGLDEPALVDAFLDSLVEEAPGLDRTLSRLGKALLRRHRPDLPLELAEQWRSEWGAQRADRHTKKHATSNLDPITELVSASGLMAPDEVGHGPERGQVAWRFSHERLGEQIILRELLASIAPRTVPTGEEIVGWATSAAGTPRDGSFSALIGALEILVARLVARGESAFAMALLDIDDQATRTRLLDAVLLGLGAIWDEDDEIPPAAKTLDALVHASMLRDRGKRFLSAAWRPLLELIGRGRSPAARALHRSMFEVARATYGNRSEEARLPYATTLEALGQAAYRHGDDEDARRYFEETVRQLTDVAARTGASDAIRSILAAAHRRIARVERDRQQHRRARKSLETALRVASHTDDASQPLPSGQHQELLLSLLALGDQLRAMASLREAEQAYEEALRASLAALVEAPHRSDLRDSRAAALAGLAEVAAATNRPEVARERFGNTLRVLRKLTRREPQRWDYHLELVGTLQRLATLLRTTAEDHDACQLHEESAAIMLALVHAYPQNRSWRSDLVRTLANLGVLMRQIGEDEPARACLEDAVRHGRVLPEDPATRRALTSALTSLVQLDEVEGRRFEAHKHVDEALVLLRQVSRDPHATTERRCLALELIAQGRLASDDGNADAAGAHLNEAVRVLSELAAGAPDDMSLQADLGAAINGLRYLGGGGRVRRIPKHSFSAMVTERGGSEIREFFGGHEITIGRAPGNDLMLPNYSVSRHHATVSFHDGTFTIEDLESKHGVTVGGKRVSGPVTFRAGEKVELGDFVLVFEGPIDTSYGGQWSSMMANSPTGFPPPAEGPEVRTREASSLEVLAGGASEEDPDVAEPDTDSAVHVTVDIDE